MLSRFGHFLFWFLGEVEIVHVIQGLNTVSRPEGCDLKAEGL